MPKILGIDEAGRGPVIGSMYAGGFIAEEKEIENLEKIGVKDSKKLSDSKREKILSKLNDYGVLLTREVTAEEIDSLRQVMTLNDIEIQAFTELIKKTQPDKIIIDLPEPNEKKFVRKIKKELPAEYQEIEIIAKHGADDDYPIVSAASIAAKSAREKHIEELKEKYGYDLGSGYPHDEKAVNFLKEYLKQEEELPIETRKSWASAQRIKREHEQKNLGEYKE